MLTPDPTLLTLEYQADLGVLIISWQREGTLPEVQAGYHTIEAAALEYGAQRWLMDCRRFNITLALTDWVTHTWLPGVLSQLPGQLRLAALVVPERWAALTATPDIQQLAIKLLAPQPTFQTQVFTDEGTAGRWLTI